MLPKRPAAHELETESRNYVRSTLPQSWVVEDVFSDYGTDLRVEIVSQGELTGLFFFMQVKAHENVPIDDDNLLEDVDVGHIRYYLRLPVPVFLVVYDRNRRRAVYQDVRSYVEDVLTASLPGWELQRTVRFRIPATNLLQDSTSAIERVVKDFYDKHGLTESRPEPDPLVRLAGVILAALAESHPDRKLFSKMVRDAMNLLKLTKRTRIDEERLRGSLLQFAVVEKSSQGDCLRLQNPSPVDLARAAALVHDDYLSRLLTSPWAKSIKEPYFRAFLIVARLRPTGKLLSAIPTFLRRDREAYFAILDELLSLDPETLQKIPGVAVESLIRSTGEQVIRNTSFRFNEASLNSAYEEFIAGRDQPEWTEIVTTPTHSALVKLRMETTGKPLSSRARVLESSVKNAKFAFEVIESARGQGELVSLVDIPVIQPRGTDQSPLISVFSEAAQMQFRGGLLEAFQIAGGQQVKLRPIIDPAGYGVRLFVDEVPVIEMWMGIDLRGRPIPSEIKESIERAKADSRLHLILVIMNKARAVIKEKRQVIDEIVARIRVRHPNLVVGSDLLLWK